MSILLPTAYLPPVSYFSALLKAEEILIEQHEHYIKQTYRNRTEIYGANGLLPLVIPVNHHDLFVIPIHEVKISHEQPWRKIHWRSIESAYRNSPYFEFYEGELKTFYEKEYEYLFNWNRELMFTLLRLMGADKKISFTGAYQKQYEGIIDLRNSFLPGPKNITPHTYHQVFADRHGFIADLSIIDILFNEGPRTVEWLKKLPG